MKKTYSILFILVMTSCLVAQEKSEDFPIPYDQVVPTGTSLTITDAVNGKTITLYVGEKLFVQLPDERHFVFGNEEYGLEVLSTVSFQSLSNKRVLIMRPIKLQDNSILQDDRSFIADAAGSTTLSYNRTKSYVSYGAYSLPVDVPLETISFNIIVKQ